MCVQECVVCKHICVHLCRSVSMQGCVWCIICMCIDLCTCRHMSVSAGMCVCVCVCVGSVMSGEEVLKNGSATGRGCCKSRK